MLLALLIAAGVVLDPPHTQRVCGVDPATGKCVPVKVSADGTVATSGGGAGGGTASSVTINDAVTPARTLTIDALGKIAINNSAFDITDRVGRALGVVSVTGSVAVTGTFWQATQPISALALPLPAGASTDRTTAAAPFSVRLSDGAAFLDPRSIRALTSADVVSAAQSGTWTFGLPSGASQEHTTAAAPASVELSTGAAFYDARDQGVAAATAGAWPAKVTDGTTVAAVDPTFRSLRASLRPPEALGYYRVASRTPTYGGQVAGAPLVMLRNPSATVLIEVLRVRVSVAQTAAATAAGGVARELIVGRLWSASDTGTAINLTTNANTQKGKTSQATSIADLKHGGPLTAGTRTLDTTAHAQVVGWTGLTTTGIILSVSPNNFGTSTAGTNVALGGQMAALLDALAAGEESIVLAQNEGVLIRIGQDAEPTGATQQTYWEIVWREVTASSF